MKFKTLEKLIHFVARDLQPLERMSVSECSEKYRHLRNIGSYVGPWRNDKAPYLVDVMNSFESPTKTAVIFVASAQCGKALTLDTPVLTPTGMSDMGSVKVGDYVISEKGFPVSVLGKSEVMENKEVYEIAFDNGEKIKACSEHLWLVSDLKENSEKILSTKEMFENGVLYRKVGSRYAIKNTQPIVLPRKQQTIDPYILGYWIGDGSTQGRVSLGDHISSQVRFLFKSKGYENSLYRSQNRCDSIYVPRMRRELSDMRLSNVGSKHKYIPKNYLFGSLEQRRELAKGLMDSDGTVKKGSNTVQLSFTNKKLLDQCFFLFSSLGYKVHKDSRTPKIGDKNYEQHYRLSFTVYEPFNVFKLDYHINKFNTKSSTKPTQTNRKFIRRIREVPTEPVVCIKVDNPKKLFLAGPGCTPTHNTETFLNWLNYVQLCDPSDMLLVQTSMKRAQNYSETNLERFKTANREYRNRMLPGRHNDGVLKKRFRSGTLLNLSWPSIRELSGRTVRRIFLTDYDRNEENIGGEGDCFQLAVHRTTSFKHRGMTVAESTPGTEIEDSRWEPSTKHEAPPARKILSLYNRGTRKRWYWKCTGCHTRFEPDFSLMKWEEKDDIPSSAATCYLECPKCEKRYYEGGVDGKDSKYLMNLSGKWLADGCSFDEDDNIIGEEPISDFDSYWLKGVCAAFSKWSKLVSEYLEAEKEYEKTGSEEALKTCYNTSLGEPYQYKSNEIHRLPEHLKARAKDLGERVIPKGVRFLIANIDVQKNMFVVQVHGYGVRGDVWIVDRFNVQKSERLDDDGHPLWVKPGSYLEDWKLLIPQVLQKSYELDDGSGRRMLLKAISCDSAGQKGVTPNAYNFFRYLKYDYQEDPTLFKRFILTKGRSTTGGNRAQITYPDSDRKDRNAEGRGEIPVLMLDMHQLKDTMNLRLEREEAGGGRVNFPKWLPTWFYEEMCAERVEKGKWVPIAKRNEAWDLLVYSYGVAITPRFAGIEMIMDWDDAPEWAAEWDKNSLIVDKDGEKIVDKEPKKSHTMEELSDILG